MLAREREADAAVAEAQRVLADEWGAWATQQVAALRARYDRAVGAFLDEIAVVMAGALVLGSSATRLTAITRGITIPHATDPWKNCANPTYLKGREVAAARELAERIAVVAARVMPLMRDLVDAPNVTENAGVDRQVETAFGRE